MNPKICALALAAVVSLSRLCADPVIPPRPPGDKSMKPEETEFWTPVPPVVSAPAGAVPSDAIVLFDGRNLDAWQSNKGDAPAPWKIEDGAMVVVPGSGDIRTKASFGDIQLHLEFREPTPVVGNGQGRGNSGVFFMDLYELQVLDSYDNPTYANGQLGSVYKQVAPLVNASRPPGEWQSYDAVWIAPRFAPDGSLRSPARLTVFHNGVLILHDVALYGPTNYQGLPHYVFHAARLPLALQEHHNPVAFRNIWIRELSLPQ
jgi:hypothetical protein